METFRGHISYVRFKKDDFVIAGFRNEIRLFGDDGRIFGAQMVGTDGVEVGIDTIATAMRGGLAPPRSARARYSQPTSMETAATARVNSHCHRGPRNTRAITTGINTTAVRMRFIQG